MDESISYLCDGLVPECSDKIGCFRCMKPGMSDCKHTSDPEHAANGACEDPWNHPERFEKIRLTDSEDIWWETEPGRQFWESNTM